MSMRKPSRVRRSSRFRRVESLETRALMTIAAVSPLPDLGATVGSAAVTVELGEHFDDPAGKSDFALFNTSLGTIPVRLTPSTTPKTVANFVNYVNKGAYNDSIVHRSVPGFVWQAGGYQSTATPSIVETKTDAPVQNEFGASNTRGTIAMAKLGGDPDSATSQFFFNLSDQNASNLDAQNGGFTVFGRVVGDSGLAVMDAIASTPVPTPGPLASPLNSAPLLNYKAGAKVEPSNLVLIRNVTMADEAFSAASDAPGVATASIQGDRLVVTPIAAGSATITVVGFGADGSTVTDSFVVNVAPGSAPATPTPATPVPTTPTTPALPGNSRLTPTLQGRSVLPDSAIAGGRVRIQLPVSLAASGSVSQRTQVQLVLSPKGGAGDDVAIASTMANVRARTGRQARVNLAARRLDAGVAPGVYDVLVSVIDPDGARTTIGTGETLVVQAG